MNYPFLRSDSFARIARSGSNGQLLSQRCRCRRYRPRRVILASAVTLMMAILTQMLVEDISHGHCHPKTQYQPNHHKRCEHLIDFIRPQQAQSPDDNAQTNEFQPFSYQPHFAPPIFSLPLTACYAVAWSRLSTHSAWPTRARPARPTVRIKTSIWMPLGLASERKLGMEITGAGLIGSP
jgi:hypothetical protein